MERELADFIRSKYKLTPFGKQEGLEVLPRTRSAGSIDKL